MQALRGWCSRGAPLVALSLGTLIVSASAASGQPAARRPDLGRSITLRSDDELLRITLLKVQDPAHVIGQFGAPAAGNKLVAVQLKLTNLSHAFYHDSPGNGTKLISTSGRMYSTVLPGVDPNLDGLGGMDWGESQVGRLTFEVPIKMRPWKLRFVLDSGFADHVGQWLLR
jgi:hypothetical protein